MPIQAAQSYYAGKGRLLVLDYFGHMVNFKLWHDLRFLRFLRSSKKLQYDPGQTPRVNEGPTMKRDTVIIICVDASSEPPAVCPRHWWSPTRHPATNQIMTSWPWYSQPMIQGNSASTARPPNQTRRGLSICSEHYTSSSTWLEQHTHPLSLPHVWITGFVYKEQKTTENMVLPLRVTS